MRPVLLALVLVGVPMLAAAQDGDGRYVLQTTPDGVVRLDTRTGAVTHCRQTAGSLVCRLAADERRDLEAEIARLTRENEVLRARSAERPQLRLPSDAEIDGALSTMERFLDRAMRMLDRWRRPETDRT